MEKLLSGAKSMRVTSTRFRKYEKQGDANTALKDFYSVQPANVQRKSAFSFGRGSTGDVRKKFLHMLRLILEGRSNRRELRTMCSCIPRFSHFSMRTRSSHR